MHELDGNLVYINSFDFKDILFKYTNNNEIDFKFLKMTV